MERAAARAQGEETLSAMSDIEPTRDKTDIVTKLSPRSVADRLASHRAGGQQGNDAVRRDGSERGSTPSRTSAARHHAGDLRQPGPGNIGSGLARAEGRGAETKTRHEESCIT